MRSSNASAPCRFELRPSRWTTAALLALAALAPFAALHSAMPRAAAWPLAAVAALLCLRLAWREWRRPLSTVLIDGDGAVSVDGVAVEDFRIDWRGPLAFLSWRDRAGRRHRRGLWPDALGPALRRELRLLTDRDDAGRRPGGMAP